MEQKLVNEDRTPLVSCISDLVAEASNWNVITKFEAPATFFMRCTNRAGWKAVLGSDDSSGKVRSMFTKISVVIRTEIKSNLLLSLTVNKY